MNSWGFLVPLSKIYLLINDTAHTIALYSTVKCDGVYHVSFIIYSMNSWRFLVPLSHIHLLINNTALPSHFIVLYHLLVGIYENGYPLAHIPTDKWYSVYTIALYSTNNCDMVPSSNLHDVHLPQKSQLMNEKK